MEFTVKSHPGKPIKAIIELKSRLTPMILEGVVHQVLRYRNELRRSGSFDDLYPMVAAPYRYVGTSTLQRTRRRLHRPERNLRSDSR